MKSKYLILIILYFFILQSNLYIPAQVSQNPSKQFNKIPTHSSTPQITSNNQKPNFLIILADDLGYSDLGSYGGEIDTPNIDQLANNGLRFTQFYNCARCLPTRTSLITGYYFEQVSPRPRWATTIPRLLKPQGYRSYHSGKWHVYTWKKIKAQAGFDNSYNLADSNRFFNPQAEFINDKRLAQQEKRPTGFYATTEITNHALEQLKQHAKQHPEKPFFQYLAYTSPHFPLHALQKDIDKYHVRYKSGWDVLRTERMQHRKKLGFNDTTLAEPEPQIIAPSGKPSRMNILGTGEIDHTIPWDQLTDQQKEFQATKMAIHAAMVDRMDQEIGRVIKQLKEMGEFDNTVIFFLSDNGASAEILIRGDGHNPEANPGSAESYLCLGPGWSTASNTPMRRHKIWTHEGGIATPLIVHWPKGIKAKNEFRHQPGHVVDFAPTFLELAGAKTAPGTGCHPDAPPYPGQSLVSAFDENKETEREFIYFDHRGNRALRVGDWKVVSAKIDQDVWELYNLAKDRGETKNLADKFPERLKQMTTNWAELNQRYHSQAGPKPKRK